MTALITIGGVSLIDILQTITIAVLAWTLMRRKDG